MLVSLPVSLPDRMVCMTKTRMIYLLVLALVAYATFAPMALAGPHDGAEI